MNKFSIETVPCFPSTVFILDLEEDFLNFGEKLKNNYRMTSINQSDSIGSYISESLTVLDDFPNEKNILVDYFNFIKNEILFYGETEFKITTSWITKTCEKSFSHFHVHKNCMLSGVFYFDDDYESSSGFIEFRMPGFKSDSFSVIPSKTNIYNVDEFRVKPIKNRLIIFPSYLPHRINSTNSLKTRYSLAFNLFPVGQIGFKDSSVTVTI